jgi:hypothetical protein
VGTKGGKQKSENLCVILFGKRKEEKRERAREGT